MKKLILITNLVLISSSLVFANDIRIPVSSKDGTFSREEYAAPCPICLKNVVFHNGNYLSYFENTECEHFKYFMINTKGKKYIVFGESEIEVLKAENARLKESLDRFMNIGVKK